MAGGEGLVTGREPVPAGVADDSQGLQGNNPSTPRHRDQGSSEGGGVRGWSCGLEEVIWRVGGLVNFNQS